MRAIRYNLAKRMSDVFDTSKSQSAMRAIRYNLEGSQWKLYNKEKVAIRYACNKI